MFYSFLIESTRTEHSHEPRVQAWFNKNIEWSTIYEAPFLITRNSYTLQTQFKISHNILPTREKLFQWKVEPSPHCICGVVDTNLHFIAQCKLIKPFWSKVFSFIKSTLEVSFPVSDYEIYFGIENLFNDNTIDSINYIILVAKVFIWREKRWGRPFPCTTFFPSCANSCLSRMPPKVLKS